MFPLISPASFPIKTAFWSGSNTHHTHHRGASLGLPIRKHKQLCVSLWVPRLSAKHLDTHRHTHTCFSRSSERTLHWWVTGFNAPSLPHWHSLCYERRYRCLSIAYVAKSLLNKQEARERERDKHTYFKHLLGPCPGQIFYYAF